MVTDSIQGSIGEIPIHIVDTKMPVLAQVLVQYIIAVNAIYSSIPSASCRPFIQKGDHTQCPRDIELLGQIKVPSQKEDPSVKVQIPFDKGLFHSTLAVSGTRVQDYTITLSNCPSLSPH